MDERRLFVDAIKLQVGRGYQYDVLDCSQVIINALRAAGRQMDDISAQGLYDLFKGKPVDRLQAPHGSLYFYGKDAGHITHVMTVVEHWDGAGIVLVGARGGDRACLTLEDAAKRRAFVGAVWGDYWLSQFVSAVDPFQ